MYVNVEYIGFMRSILCIQTVKVALSRSQNYILTVLIRSFSYVEVALQLQAYLAGATSGARSGAAFSP